MAKGPRFYKGSSHDTIWNKDICWQRYCEKEAHVLGFKSIGSTVIGRQYLDGEHGELVMHKPDRMNESWNAALPPLFAGSSLHAKRRTPRAIGATVQQLGLSPRLPAFGMPPAAALRPRASAELTPRVDPTAPGAPPRPQPSRHYEPSLASAVYSDISASINQDVLENRLKDAKAREGRLKEILAKQQRQCDRVADALAKAQASEKARTRDGVRVEEPRAKQKQTSEVGVQASERAPSKESR
jgi:hypothetical protein